jgi:hypothetical protein
MPYRRPPNRAKDYRRLAEECRSEANAMEDAYCRKQCLIRPTLGTAWRTTRTRPIRPLLLLTSWSAARSFLLPADRLNALADAK